MTLSPFWLSASSCDVAAQRLASLAQFRMRLAAVFACGYYTALRLAALSASFACGYYCVSTPVYSGYPLFLLAAITAFRLAAIRISLPAAITAFRLAATRIFVCDYPHFSFVIPCIFDFAAAPAFHPHNHEHSLYKYGGSGNSVHTDVARNLSPDIGPPISNNYTM